MIYLDASAIVAILGRENDADTLLAALEKAGAPYIVSPTGLFEATLGLAAKKARASGRGLDADLIEGARRSIDEFLANIGATQIDITSQIGSLAIEAAKRYSRAVGSPAALNFGDCFAYACAAAHDAPLLYKGNDFVHTDRA